MKTFVITSRLVVDEQTDEALQTPASIEDEITSWLSDLRAEVSGVRVEEVER